MFPDLFEGAQSMAVEILATALIFLAVTTLVGCILLAIYFAAKLLQALVRYAVRQLRAKAFTQPEHNFYPATLASSCERPAFHVSEE